ncbi:MAG: farnesyltranstransferase [Robiginitomaculum sp.]|nr:MAG: farnesyltranstransferase [Robiginitomaculum sp.]
MTITAEPVPETKSNAMARLEAAFADDMAKVNALIIERMQSPVGMIPDLASHLVRAGGKRLRPLITLASADLAGYAGDAHYKLAATVEFIHSATLLHDDIVDGSPMRRGKPAANTVWGNAASVLVGDFLFARAFSLMVETGRLRVLDILAGASSIIAEGEVRQLAAIANLDMSEREYMQIIEAKTAELFASAARVSAVIADLPETQEVALDRYGRELGLAFQLVDDALDYAGNAKKLGKAVGDDFREGKVTMPVAKAIQAASKEEQVFWTEVFGKQERDKTDLQHAMALITRHNTLQITLDQAQVHVDNAKASLQIFAPTNTRKLLCDVCDFVLDRSF